MEPRPWHAQYDPVVPSCFEIPSHPLHEFLRHAARVNAQQPALQYNTIRLTYQQLDELSDRAARSLVAMGLAPGQAVGICLPNLPQFVLLYFAILKAGGVVSAMNPRATAFELQNQVKEVQPRLVFCVCEKDEAPLRRQQFETVERLIFTAADDAGSLASCLGSSQPFTSEPAWLLDFLQMDPAVGLPVVNPDDDCIYQYTGGTTGTPKAAAAVHRSLVANTLQFSKWLSTLRRGEERTLAAIPLYHVYGMVIGMCVSLALQSTIVLHDERKGIGALPRLIEAEQITLFPAVPYLLEMLLLQPGIRDGSNALGSLKVVISGASPLRAQCLEQYQGLLKGRLIEGYGLSEAPTATHCNPLQGEHRPASIGLPLPCVDVRIVALDNPCQALPPGEIGELALRSPQVMRAYLNRPRETDQVLQNGWLLTGDLARMDADGYFYIVDRKKDLIKVSGFTVYPAEVEAVLTRHPAVRDAGVIGVPDPLHGEKVAAWLVIDPDAAITLEEIQQWCRQSLSGYKVPREMHHCEKIPRSALGKLLRRELRALQE